MNRAAAGRPGMGPELYDQRVTGSAMARIPVREGLRAAGSAFFVTFALGMAAPTFQSPVALVGIPLVAGVIRWLYASSRIRGRVLP